MTSYLPLTCLVAIQSRLIALVKGNDMTPGNELCRAGER
jgi:hypothetical protein